MTLSSYKNNLFRPINQFSCNYPLTHWYLLTMPSVSRQRNRIPIRTQQKHNFILSVLNLKRGFSVFKCGKPWTGYRQFNDSSLPGLGVFFFFGVHVFCLPIFWLRSHLLHYSPLHLTLPKQTTCISLKHALVHTLFLLPTTLASQSPLPLNSLNSWLS